MELTKEDVQKISELARIGVTDEDVVNYQKDLSAVLSYFEKLQEVNTEEIEGIGHITGMTNVYRADRAEEFDDEGKKIMHDNMPSSQDGYIKVKSVL